MFAHARDVFVPDYSLHRLCTNAKFTAVCSEGARAELADPSSTRLGGQRPSLRGIAISGPIRKQAAGAISSGLSASSYYQWLKPPEGPPVRPG